MRKLAEKGARNEDVWGPLGSFWVIWELIRRAWQQNEVSKGAQERFYGYHKNTQCFFLVLDYSFLILSGAGGAAAIAAVTTWATKAGLHELK